MKKVLTDREKHLAVAFSPRYRELITKGIKDDQDRQDHFLELNKIMWDDSEMMKAHEIRLAGEKKLKASDKKKRR